MARQRKICEKCCKGEAIVSGSLACSSSSQGKRKVYGPQGFKKKIIVMPKR